MVFLVDDDSDDLEILQEAFIRSGFDSIVCATNGQDFLSKLSRSVLPELIVLDLNMPIKDGFEVLIELKKSGALSDVPVVILTTSTNKQDEKRCVELGCKLFMRKPSTVREYDAIVMTMLDTLQNFREENSHFSALPEE